MKIESVLRKVFWSASLPVSIGLVIQILLPLPSEAADFSRNPFLESEKALAKTRSYATILNQPQSTKTPSSGTSLSGVIIGAPERMSTVDDTPFGGGVFSPGFGYAPYYGGYTGLRSYSGLWGGGRAWRNYGYWGGLNAGLNATINNFAFGRGYYGGYYGGGYSPWGWGSPYSYGGWGWGADPELGEMGSSAMVFDNTPSKSSGNYYAPSTPDSSASGSYYSNTGPSINMPIKPYTTPRDYWGQSGSPLPKDINKVPW